MLADRDVVSAPGLQTTGQGVGEHEHGGGLELAAQQIGGAGRLEPQGPPVLAARVDLGELHLAPRLLAQALPTTPLTAADLLLRQASRVLRGPYGLGDDPGRRGAEIVLLR